jgi:plastocyanin domain-containing protein
MNGRNVPRSPRPHLQTQETIMKTRSVWTLPLAAALAALTITACSGAKQEKSAGGESVAIRVTEEGFVPKEIRVKAGQPVTLAVTRKTERTCATELVLAEYHIDQKLPMNETVQIRFTPSKAGRLTYACDMDMIKGHIIVE